MVCYEPNYLLAADSTCYSRYYKRLFGSTIKEQTSIFTENQLNQDTCQVAKNSEECQTCKPIKYNINLSIAGSLTKSGKAWSFCVFNMNVEVGYTTTPNFRSQVLASGPDINNE